MARKKRRFDTTEAPQTTENNAPKERYEDAFQQKLGNTFEDIGRKFEGQGKNILYGLGALLVLGVIVWIIFSWSARSEAQAQTALGKAIVTSQTTVTDQALPAGSTERVFKTQRERAEVAIPEFQSVVDTYGGDAGEKAKFFIAVNRMTIDRAAGMQELEALSKSSDVVGSQAKFALAQAKEAEGKFDEAVNLYKELAASNNKIIAKETIDFELASIYEKQDKKADAVNVLFELVKTATDAKDTEGKPVPLNSTAQKAKTKLAELDPVKAKEIPEQAPSGASPFGF